MNNPSINKIRILNEYFPINQSVNQDMDLIKQPNRPQYLQYLDKKLPQNHPRIQILEKML